MKKIAVLVGALSLTLVWMFFPRSTSRANKIVTIDGSENAQAIPDRVAYSLILRLLSSAKDDNERRHIRSYISRMGFQNMDDVRILSTTAENFRMKVADLDSRIAEIRKAEVNAKINRRSEIQRQLSELQMRMDAIVDEAIQSLSRSLSKPGHVQLQNFMNSQFKAKVKLQINRTDSR